MVCELPWAALGRMGTWQKGASLARCFYGPTCIATVIAILFAVKFIYFESEEEHIRCSCKSLLYLGSLAPVHVPHFWQQTDKSQIRGSRKDTYIETEVLYDFGKNGYVINKIQRNSKMGDTRPSFKEEQLCEKTETSCNVAVEPPLYFLSTKN